MALYECEQADGRNNYRAPPGLKPECCLFLLDTTVLRARTVKNKFESTKDTVLGISSRFARDCGKDSTNQSDYGFVTPERDCYLIFRLFIYRIDEYIQILQTSCPRKSRVGEEECGQIHSFLGAYSVKSLHHREPEPT